MEFTRSKALQALPPYLFIEIDKKKKAALAAGVDLIDLGVGDPDKPTPKALLKALKKASDKPANHQYPLGSGLPAYRQAVVKWFKQRFGVNLDWASEVTPFRRAPARLRRPDRRCAPAQASGPPGQICDQLIHPRGAPL